MPPRKAKKPRGKKLAPRASATVSNGHELPIVVPGSSDDGAEEDHCIDLTSRDKVKSPEPKEPQDTQEPIDTLPDLNTDDTSVKETATASTSKESDDSDSASDIQDKLTPEQEEVLVEFFKEHECFYNKRHRQHLNKKYKFLLKREQAEKMGIDREYL